MRWRAARKRRRTDEEAARAADYLRRSGMDPWEAEVIGRVAAREWGGNALRAATFYVIAQHEVVRLNRSLRDVESEP